MKRHLYILLGVIVVFGFSRLPSSADLTTQSSETPMAATASHSPAKPIFVTGDEKVWSDFPKKPALGSKEDQADLQTILSVQASRTAEQKDEAMKDKHYQIILVTDVIDPAFKTKYPNIYGVLEQADNDCYFITTKLKNENARLRPYEQYPTQVQPLFKTGGLSYPSGHASGVELQARILATLFHANGQDALLLKRAKQVGDSRVVAGVHYPSDVKEGMDLGDLLFAQLEANPKFTAELAAAAKADKVPTP